MKTILVYTGQMKHWRSLPRPIDITARTVSRTDSPGWILAPSWSLVNRYRAGYITADAYTKEYFKILENRLAHFRPAFRDFIRYNHEVTLVCFCRPGVFCHRVLAAQFLERVCGPYNIELVNLGEFIP